ncbi:TonB-dependent receptor [Pseudocolwellia sp. HL-MZ19]|uniref:TonB-dependent receptor n=1 Tax=Pseudocolwellia sp. HL-MZ19 TaxID=3400846 RepID=UPI003CEBAD63
MKLTLINKLFRMRLHICATLLAILSPSIFAAEEISLEDKERIIEIISVSGIRQSLQTGIDLKRADSRIIDAVVAEDIGKLPDNNIAEALQRITGVSINREFGVGSEVSIRGLSQNRVELNGRSTLGDGRKGVNFQDFPSYFLSEVEVIKSPTPEMIEGALGGTINLKTQQPLQLRKYFGLISLKGEYTDNSEKTGPIFHATFGDKWKLDAGGNIGMLGSFTYQDRELIQHESRVGLNANTLNVNNPNVDPAEVYVIPVDYTYFPQLDRRERSAGNMMFQWEPESKNVEIYLDATFTKREGNNQTYTPTTLLHSPFSNEAEKNADFSIEDKKQLNSYYDSDVVFENGTSSSFRATDSLGFAFGGSWIMTNNIDISGEINFVSSTSSEPYYDMRFFAIDPVAEAANPLASNYLLNGVTYYSDNKNPPSVLLDDPNTFTNRDNWALGSYDVRDNAIDNNETATRFDLTYYEPFLEMAAITSLDTGLRFTTSSFKKSQNSFKLANLHTSLTRNGENILLTMNDFPENSIKDYSFDAFPGNNQVYDLSRFAMFDNDILQKAGKTTGILNNLLVGTNVGSDSETSFNYDEYAVVDEETLAAYLQFNIDTKIAGYPLRSIVGGRYVYTNLSVESYETDDEDNNILVRTQRDYSDFLPSLNITLELSKKTLVRFAAANVMRRAEFLELSPSYVVSNDSTTASHGNPYLNPYRATQFDVSVEQYWGKGNMLSGAIFYKDVKSFLKTEEECWNNPDYVAVSSEVNREDMCYLDGRTGQPTATSDLAELGLTTTYDSNGEGGKVQGIEISYQQLLKYGLGTSFNYTYADSEDPDDIPLLDISKNTVNAAIFYEKNGISTRFAYTYRSRFLEDDNESRLQRVGQLGTINGENDPTVRQSFREPIKQLDWSASYDFSEGVRLQMDIVNLLKEPTRDSTYLGSVYQIRQADRRFSVGVRYMY